MAGYCTRCGRPLPDSGVCPCMRQRKTAPRRGGNPLLTVLVNLPRLWRSYFRDPISTPRLAGERRDWITGVAVLLLLEAMSLLSALMLTLRYGSARFFLAAPQWATAGLVCPLLVMAAMIGVIYALSGLSRMQPDIRTVLAVMGVSAVLPLSALTVSAILSLIHISLFTVGTVLTVAAWIVSFFVMLYEVLGLRLNTLSILTLVGPMALIYGAVAFSRSWLLAAIF